MSLEPIDPWIQRLNDGDDKAVEQMFLTYEPYLRIAVRRRLSPRLRTKVDSGDIVQSVFADMVRGVRDGGWKFAGRPQLLALLHKIARRRIADRYQKHGAAIEKEHSIDDTSTERFADTNQPRPSQEAQGREFLESVLRACPPAHHEVVRLRMNGYRMAEIAAQTGFHEGSVRRILYELARRLAIVRKAVLPED